MMPAQQQLRRDHHRHELHGLKLGAGERTTQQAQPDAEHRVDDRDDEHQIGLPAVSRPRNQNDTMHAIVACAAAAIENAVP